MTADIRDAARKEAAEVFIEPRKNDMLPVDFIAKGGREGFLAGAVWAVSRVTPTREQVAEVLSQGYQSRYKPSDRLPVNHHDLRAADAVLALMTGLAEGES